MDFQLVPPSNVVTGVLLSVVSLIPSCPLELRPQFHKVPSVLSATVCRNPQAMDFQLVPPNNVVTGVFLSVVSLIPSRPLSLRPQDHNDPSVLSATV